MADTKERKLPAPSVSMETQAYWDAAAKGKLLIKKCTACGQLHHYPRVLCPFCFSDKTEWVEASGKGTIFPQPPLSDGRLMDDVVGDRFAVVGQTSLLTANMPDAVPLDGVGADWLAERGLRAAILRPDRYIFDVA